MDMEGRGRSQREYYMDNTEFNGGVEEVGYNTFIQQVSDFTLTAQDNPAPRPSSRSERSRSFSGPGSSRGSIRFYLHLAKARAKVTMEREQLEKEHDLKKQQADIQHQLRLLENERTLAHLDLESEHPDEEEGSDFLNKLKNVPSLCNSSKRGSRTEEWAKKHFKLPKLSVPDPLLPEVTKCSNALPFKNHSFREPLPPPGKESPSPCKEPPPPCKESPSPCKELPPPCKESLPPCKESQPPCKESPLSSCKESPLSPFKFKESPVPPVEQYPSKPKSSGSLHSNYQSQRTILSSAPPDVKPTIQHFNIQPTTHLNPLTPSWMPDVAMKMTSIADTMGAITSSLKLPPIDIPVFKGEDGTFLNFISIFQHQIEVRELDESRRLQYLIQFTHGHPQELVNGCVALPAHSGFRTAKALLVERYGEPFEISMCYVRRLTKPDRIPANDRKALRAFSDELKICTNALEGTGYIHEINSSDNLRRIVRRLPDWAIKKWNSHVDNLRRRRESPGIDHICEFVDNQSRIVNDPIFGGLMEDETRRKPGKPGRSGAEGSRTGFVGIGSRVKPGDQTNEHSNSNVGSGSGSNPNPPPDPAFSKCPKCQEGHSLFKCPKFKALSVPERTNFVKSCRLCFLCFRKGHVSRECRRTDICGIDGCTVKHARFLHQRTSGSPDAGSTPPSTNASTTANGDSGTTTTPTASGDTNAVSASTSLATPRHAKGAGTRLLPILPIRLTSPESGRTSECYALLDSGSDTTFLLDSTLAELHAPTRVETITLHTLGGTVHREANVTDLIVSDVNGCNSFPLPNVYSQPSMTIRRNDRDVANALASWSHLKDVSTEYLDCSDVKLIIGTDAPDVLAPLEVRRGLKGAPFAVRTKLGWTVLGPVSISPCLNVDAVTASVCCEDSDCFRLHEQLAAYFRADFCDVYDTRKGLSVSDKAALHIMEDSIHLVKGHYQMRLPWKEGCPNFPNNKVMARRRLESLKRKLLQNSVVHERYSATVEGYISDGYAEKVSADELRRLTAADSTRYWLLVHFAVYHPLKPDKTRVVFDCPAKFGGTSLNDQLLQGPDINNTMLGVILRFRQGLIAASGDVAAMFHQVRVSPDDCDSLCFLWWPGGDLRLEPVIYRMLVFVFGAICSPSAAVFALQQCARDNQNSGFDESTLQTILGDFYVDDCLTSTDDAETMKRRISELCTILKTGGFRLTKWLTTSEEVLQSVPETERAPVKPVRLSGHSTDGATVSRALGIWWDVTRDVFLFQSSLEEKPCATRRSILSSICKTFDPTGCIAPFVLPAKIILQELTRLHLDWDVPAPELYAAEWEEWKSGLPLIEKIEVPRCFKLPGTVVDQSLHHYSDASSVGYGCVTYIRTSYRDGTFSTNFVLGKSRVCPLKSITIPRLELSAAALAADMEVTIRRELTIPLSPSVFWTDSICTLGYIKNREKRYHTFVSNRIARIHEASDPQQWRYVSTEDNPADLASRGITPKNQSQVSMWLHGPTFLTQPEENWPVANDSIPSQTSVQDPEEKRPIHGLTTTATEPPESSPSSRSTYLSPLQPLFQFHSNWTRLKRAVAALLRVRSALRTPGKVDLRAHVTARDLIDAERCIIREVQYERFADEIEDLRREAEAENGAPPTVRRSSSIRKLTPELDNGLLRVGGRLRRCGLQFEAKHPCILPSRHPVVDMMIRHHHDVSGHSGRGYVLSLIRQRYWILRGNAATRRCLSKCFDCRRRTAPNCQQKMSDLPEDRVTPDQPPFTSVGVDFFGPFYVRCKRSNVKRYGCIFTCLTSRAVHVEVAHSLDTTSFLNAFHRFVARRGRPKLVRSDNGTNFRSGQKELKDAIQAWNQATIARKLAQEEIQWIFNPPAASSWGGCWERSIRSLRRILNALTREQILTDEGLLTLMCQVEGILNGRPLTAVSSDPHDLRALTPNDLLLCRPGPALPAGIFSADDNYSRRRWRQVEHLTDVFWRRWTKEYLITLQSRSKWNSESRNIEKNDIVVVQDDRVPRNCWPLGRVLEAFKGQDGLVRACRIRTANGTFIRPILKICLVECAD